MFLLFSKKYVIFAANLGVLVNSLWKVLKSQLNTPKENGTPTPGQRWGAISLFCGAFGWDRDYYLWKSVYMRFVLDTLKFSQNFILVGTWQR